MKEFWNNRYKQKQYAYGVEPNRFFAKHLNNIHPGKLLLPAEGEGRNAVYAAKQGWNVFCFDISEEAKHKALFLANKNNVKFDYQTCEFSEYYVADESFDCIALFFVHAMPEKRKDIHALVSKWLKPGGTVILQGFGKDQINYNSGGPQNTDMLFEQEDLDDDFSTFSSVTIQQTEERLNEGLYHQGMASLINLVAIK